MAFNLEGGISAVKESVLTIALPMIIGTFVVAIIMGMFRKQ